MSGLAYEEQEAALGVSCIAAPVFDGPTAAAALSMAVPRSRFHPARLAPAVRTARPRWDCRVYCERAGTRKGVPLIPCRLTPFIKVTAASDRRSMDK